MNRGVFIFFSLTILLSTAFFGLSAGPNGDAPTHETPGIKQTHPQTEHSQTAEDQKTGHKAAEHGEHHAPHLKVTSLHLAWGIPFVGILLSIALFPLLAPHFWHHHYGKVSLFWGVTFFAAFWAWFKTDVALFYLAETYLGEFIPFITLLLALFTVAGGIQVKGDLVGTPKLNTAMIMIGTVLASWMGTTGAAMLLIRPLLKANEARRYKVHTVVFFIFLVANIGGSLTPLGDPPLFLGFLQGVRFFWTTVHLLPVMLFAVVILIIVYFILDNYYYKKERDLPAPTATGTKISIEGKWNFALLGLIVGAVIFSGIWHPHKDLPADAAISLWGAGMISKGTFVQVIALLAITAISWYITPQSVRRGNDYSWEPILEVAKLFATIFITMVPVIAMLNGASNVLMQKGVAALAGPESGPLGPVIGLVVTGEGEFINRMFFWLTGLLSSFLDNAPTYLVYFNAAGGNAADLMGKFSQTLLAISAGAVFMGANTYIGNAPNFMVRSIAEEAGVPMPSFFGYMIKYSIPFLIPIFILVSLIFF